MSRIKNGNFLDADFLRKLLSQPVVKYQVEVFPNPINKKNCFVRHTL